MIHLITAFILTLIIWLWLKYQSYYAEIISVSIVWILSIGKEVYDWISYGNFGAYDLFCDAIGIVLGFCVICTIIIIGDRL